MVKSLNGAPKYEIGIPIEDVKELVKLAEAEHAPLGAVLQILKDESMLDRTLFARFLWEKEE